MERGAELREWLGVMEIAFDLTHQRIEELVGRPVWTHEMGDPESLIAETVRGRAATFDDVLAKVPGDEPAIIVEVS